MSHDDGMSRRRRDQRGMALVLVLWVITLLAVIAGSFSLGMRREAVTVRNLMEVARAQATAEAGIRLAMLGLMESDEDRRWRADGTPYEIQFGEASLTIRIRDESGRIDINEASPELIDGALLSVGLEDPSERAALRDNILSWRGDGPHSNSDVSAEQYRSTGLDYGPRNGPFASAEELMLIPGMTPTIYRRLLPLVTTHSGEGNIDIRSASRLVLMSVPGVDPGAVDAYLAEREAAREQGLPIPEFPESGNGARDTGIYSVESVSRLPSGLEQGVRVSMRAERSPNLEPFRIVHYRLDQSF